MKTIYSRATTDRAVLKAALGLAISVFLAAGLAGVAHAQTPSFTFTGTVPANVTEGATFTFPAQITDIGGPAADYNSFFQIYDQNFHYISQDYFTDQTFSTGQTLDYDVTLTAPTTPGFYFIDSLMFNQTYTSGIVSQSFFGSFNSVPAVPEASSGVATGILLLGLLAVIALPRRLAQVRR